MNRGMVSRIPSAITSRLEIRPIWSLRKQPTKRLTRCGDTWRDKLKDKWEWRRKHNSCALSPKSSLARVCFASTHSHQLTLFMRLPVFFFCRDPVFPNADDAFTVKIFSPFLHFSFLTMGIFFSFASVSPFVTFYRCRLTPFPVLFPVQFFVDVFSFSEFSFLLIAFPHFPFMVF